MKYLKTYKQINEGLRDKMLPKSDEELLKISSKLDTLGKLQFMKKYSLDKKFLPSDEEIEKELNNDSIEDYVLNKSKIKNRLNLIKRYSLDKKFLPSDEEIENDLLKKLDVFTKYRTVKDYNLDDKFLPSDEEIEKELNKLNKCQRYYQIIINYIDEKFLPSDEEIEKELNNASIEDYVYYISHLLPDKFKKIKPTEKQINDFAKFKVPERIEMIIWSNLNRILLPSDEEIENYLNTLDNTERIQFIRNNNLPKKFLRN